MEHKRDYCKLRFTCKCDMLNEGECDCDASTQELFNNNSTPPISSSSSASSGSSLQAESKSDTPSESGCSNQQPQQPKCSPVTGGGGHQPNRISCRGGAPVTPKKRWLHCVSCKTPFANAWDLMVHVQAAHMMNIYQLADTNKLQQHMAAASAGNTSQQQQSQQTGQDPSGESFKPSNDLTNATPGDNQPKMIHH